MTTNALMNQFGGQASEKLLPENMELSALSNLAVRLARYKAFEGTEDERFDLELFVGFWTESILKMKASRLLNKFFEGKSCEYEAVLFGMPELEYQVHQELVFRQINHRTSKQNVGAMFDLERVKHSSPDFLRSFLFNIGLGLTAQADLNSVMAFRCQFLER